VHPDRNKGRISKSGGKHSPLKKDGRNEQSISGKKVRNTQDTGTEKLFKRGDMLYKKSSMGKEETRSPNSNGTCGPPPRGQEGVV